MLIDLVVYLLFFNGGRDHMDGIFVKLEMFIKDFSLPHVQKQKILTSMCVHWYGWVEDTVENFTNKNVLLSFWELRCVHLNPLKAEGADLWFTSIF